MAALLLSMLLASVLAYYLERTRREREAGVVLPFSGGMCCEDEASLTAQCSHHFSLLSRSIAPPQKLSPA